ncbi:MAG TPA: hypothetical protein VL961_11570 [Acidimicrobiales bacterium]|nr:hypothetical protein [Acidimicrobiales bacterium]
MTVDDVARPEGEVATTPSSRIGALWQRLDRHSLRPFWLVVGALLVAELVTLFVYSAYLFHHFDLTDDFATYAQSWSQIAHGHLDPVDTVNAPASPFWQLHFELAMWPIALVLGHLWSSPLVLLWLQDLALVAAQAIAIVWIASVCRTNLPKGAAVATWIGGLAVVTNPWWYETASFDVHFETLGLPLVVLCGYSLWSGRGRVAVVAAIAAVAFGDVAAILVACVGIAALLSPRVWRSGGTRVAVAVCVLGVFWVGLAIALDANQGSGIVTNYGYLAGLGPHASASKVLTHLLEHPGHALHTLVHRRAGIGRVLGDAGIVGILTPWGLLISIGTLVPAALNVNQQYLAPITAFQTLAAVPFVLVGTAIVVTRMTGLALTLARDPDPSTERRRRRVPPWVAGSVALTAVAGVLAVVYVQNVPLISQLRADWWRVDARAAQTLARALDEVPGQAEVVAAQGVIGRFAERGGVYPFVVSPQAFPVTASTVDVVFAPGQGIEPVIAPVQQRDRDALAASPGARVVVQRGPITVVQLRGLEQGTRFVIP